MTLPLPTLPQFDGDEEAFPSWLAQFSAALQYTKTEKSEEKRSLLLMCISQRVVCTLISGCNQKNVATEVDFDELMLQLTLNYRTTPIQLAEYNRLFSLRQQPGQSAREFASQIGHVAGYCQFPLALKRVQAIVFSMGYRDDNVRSQLIQRDYKNCDKKGHIAAVCRSTPNQQPSQQERRQPSGEKRDNQQQHRSHQVSMDCVKIEKTAAQTTTGQVADLKTYQASIKVNGYDMLLEFDTGAAATVISEADWGLMGKPPLSTTRLPLKDFSGNRLKLKGQATVEVEYKGKRAKLPMIVGSQRYSVIGRKWIRQLEMCNCSLNVMKTTLAPRLEALLADDGTEDSDRPRSTNDADDVTAHPNDMLYASPPDSPTRSPSEFPSQAPPRASEPSPSATTEGPPPLRRSNRESRPPLRYKP
uniref:Peptidase A2 domain-containing protein n=1 Tax=Plectus sambesii TaxID=2011161 RepID=A0A914XSI0_9BILA